MREGVDIIKKKLRITIRVGLASQFNVEYIYIIFFSNDVAYW